MSLITSISTTAFSRSSVSHWNNCHPSWYPLSTTKFKLNKSLPCKNPSCFLLVLGSVLNGAKPSARRPTCLSCLTARRSPQASCAPAYGLVCSSPQAAQRTSAPLPLLPAACPLLLFPSSFKQIPPSSKTRLGPRGNSYTASSLDPSWKDPGLGPALWRPLDIIRASLVPQTVKNLPAMREARVFWSLGREEPLQKGMAAHSSIIAWRISRTEEPGGLQCMGSQSHGWTTNTLQTSQIKINLWKIVWTPLAPAVYAQHWHSKIHSPRCLLSWPTRFSPQETSTALALLPWNQRQECLNVPEVGGSATAAVCGGFEQQPRLDKGGPPQLLFVLAKQTAVPSRAKDPFSCLSVASNLCFQSYSKISEYSQQLHMTAGKILQFILLLNLYINKSRCRMCDSSIQLAATWLLIARMGIPLIFIAKNV